MSKWSDIWDRRTKDQPENHGIFDSKMLWFVIGGFSFLAVTILSNYVWWLLS